MESSVVIEQPQEKLFLVETYPPFEYFLLDFNNQLSIFAKTA